ncbi:MAG: hypothetical protein JEZ01_14510 [Labilibaculum sp.]|nr:hypothetical protein [Labilibaculum sp.]MBI9058975.1 hypothetical protein [Labilibaculum sp.]
MMRYDVFMPAGHAVFGSYKKSQLCKNKPGTKSAPLILYSNKLCWFTNKNNFDKQVDASNYCENIVLFRKAIQKIRIQ